jgi:hypothetical protein
MRRTTLPQRTSPATKFKGIRERKSSLAQIIVTDRSKFEKKLDTCMVSKVFPMGYLLIKKEK